VVHATKEPRTANGSAASGNAAGTTFVVLFTEACITMTSSRLPALLQYSQAIATDSAVTWSR
jgi:hypothetical protein